MLTKACSKCKIEKTVDSFYVSRTVPSGLACWCKDCEKQAKHKLHLSSGYKTRHNEYLRNYRKTNHITTWLRHTRSRALKAGVPFNLTEEDFIIPEKCPVLGLSLKRGDYGAKYNSPSIDRIIPGLGYTKGNVRIISYRANWLKNNATPEEIELLYKDSLSLREMPRS